MDTLMEPLPRQWKSLVNRLGMNLCTKTCLREHVALWHWAKPHGSNKPWTWWICWVGLEARLNKYKLITLMQIVSVSCVYASAVVWCDSLKSEDLFCCKWYEICWLKALRILFGLVEIDCWLKFLWFGPAKTVSFTLKSGAHVTNLVELLHIGDSRG